MEITPRMLHARALSFLFLRAPRSLKRVLPVLITVAHGERSPLWGRRHP